MALIFRPNTILHIEDEPKWKRFVFRVLSYSDIAGDVLGDSAPKLVESLLDAKVGDSELLVETQRLIQESGDRPSLLSVISAQVAKAVLSKYLPVAIISDTSFPLNGKRVVGWLQYPGESSAISIL
ncbi:MAG: hypothetical protein COY38_03590 [Candidatus Aenigmarchaeota archaeon CG_4_10_14_0_8_um_filter_37_24]|nr:hypothetical protein [Candidatus Aenigmarchaeota archaeon]OIN85947.1 MAG: hypothetical protein AUJ50_04475 [Candidatus Aenigmarchaeota archaeon CG1_02_38_14]PIV68258.1 MAG: hypothetical protein COS07_04590 [Candidatus Aenigmarchaeota archaeon CG01_land_8_20_14_3_00_37_9]PIW41212.1 MAG: hypothetical protein COW21_03005 [Candidatus Aenigmarchaeota archaeon CG15_BIG_FIL_POST_REV_8_21_14_020_37_27]PIX50249.1 MAG: hypothetical protein COZ52_05270 [Candidatus Aenigmarchaeota archaeon CG_4_8_14_3_u